MIVFRLSDILDEINGRLPDGARKYSWYALSKESGVSLSTVFRLKKRVPLQRVDAAVIERLLTALNKRQAPRLPAFTIGDLLEIVNEDIERNAQTG